MKSNKTLLTTLLSMGLLASAGATQAAGWCESGKPVKFAGLNWESGMLLTDVMQVVLEKGYDCKVDSLPGNSITMENALSSNDIQIFAEEWVGRSEVWNKAEKGRQSRRCRRSGRWRNRRLVRAALRDRRRRQA